MSEKGKHIKRSLKNVGKTAIGSIELLGGVAALVFNPIVGLPLTIDGAQRMLKGIRGEYIKDSMINVMSNKFYSKTFHKKENRIIQEFPSIRQFVAAGLTKNKMNFLLMQELNFLLGSDTFDKKGERIKYTTHSQGLTKLMLTRLQRSGMIQDLKVEDTNPKMLISEKLMLGNRKDLFKKEKMFEISFSKTDNKITEEDIQKILKIDTSDKENYNIKRDKYNNILSVNFKASKLVKDKLNGIKDKFLIGKDNLKMLPETTSKNNEIELQNIRESKDTFSEKLGILVNKSEDISMAEVSIEKKEINAESR